MKNSKFTRTIGVILGLFLIVFSANQFLHILPTSYEEMNDLTRDYLNAILPFLPALYIFEILIGLLFVFNKWLPFVSVVMAPLSINFLIFSIFNGGLIILSATLVALLNLILLFQFRDYYKPLFK